jgi:hypothetical protein
MKNASDLVQLKINHLQNNHKTCDLKRTLTCDFIKEKIKVRDCGFGCRVHFLMYCFMAAFYSDRTVLLMDDYHMNGAEDYILPISNVTCVIESKNLYNLSKFKVKKLGIIVIYP